MLDVLARQNLCLCLLVFEEELAAEAAAAGAAAVGPAAVGPAAVGPAAVGPAAAGAVGAVEAAAGAVGAVEAAAGAVEAAAGAGAWAEVVFLDEVVLLDDEAEAAAEADEELLLVAGVEEEGLDTETEGLACSAGAGDGAARTLKNIRKVHRVSGQEIAVGAGEGRRHV